MPERRASVLANRSQPACAIWLHVKVCAATRFCHHPNYPLASRQRVEENLGNSKFSSKKLPKVSFAFLSKAARLPQWSQPAAALANLLASHHSSSPLPRQSLSMATAIVMAMATATRRNEAARRRTATTNLSAKRSPNLWIRHGGA